MRGLGSLQDALPLDVLLKVMLELSDDLAAIGALGATATSLNAVAHSDDLWRSLLSKSYGSVIAIAFGGKLPLPPPRHSWRAHYFAFARTWPMKAKELHGRVILRIHNKVYDATSFVDDHPGSPMFLLATAGTEAADAFSLAGHSENARRILSAFAVPALDPFWPTSPQQHPPPAWQPASHHHTSTTARTHRDPAPTRREGRVGVRVLAALILHRKGWAPLADALSALASAAATDLERLGRDPVTQASDPTAGGAEEDEATATAAAVGKRGIQRLLPVTWHLVSNQLWASYCELRHGLE